MVRSVFSKVMWVGRATVFMVGFAVILALVFGVASAALGADGDFFKVGRNNLASAISTLTKNGAGPALRLNVDSGPPLAVNSDQMVRNLNADKVDGLNSSQLQEPRGYAHITDEGTVDGDYPEKGIETGGVVIPEGQTSVYCFALTFTPKAAVGSPHINNSAVVAAVTPDDDPFNSDAITQNCPPTHRDAAVKTYGSNTGTAVPINFQIVFM
jgi:hypothetical protein